MSRKVFGMRACQETAIAASTASMLLVDSGRMQKRIQFPCPKSAYQESTLMQFINQTSAEFTTFTFLNHAHFRNNKRGTPLMMSLSLCVNSRKRRLSKFGICACGSFFINTLRAISVSGIASKNAAFFAKS